MTDDQINDEIMRQLGWEFRCGGWRRGDDEFVNASDAPNFAGSLDAMHEALKTMADIEFETYYDELRDQKSASRPTEKRRHLLSCEARCQAEAFLRVKGAWKE